MALPMTFLMADRVLISGASGLVGSYLFSWREEKPEGGKVFGTSYTKGKTYTLDSRGMKKTISLDITNAAQVKEVIQNIDPHIVILAAALADMDRCEAEPELAVKINVQGVENVAACCQERLLVYYSTDAIFDGARGDYHEEDAPHPINFYGETKLRAENIVKTVPQHLILRICMLYSDHHAGPKFVNWLIRNLAQGKAVGVATNLTTRPTFVGDIAKATFALLAKKRRGVYHVASSSVLSCYDMAQIIARIWRFNAAFIRPVLRKDLPWKAQRPLYGTLNIDKFRRENIPLLTFEEGMQRLYSLYPQSLYQKSFYPKESL